jgi:Domain of unknown function (DUF3471)/Beta-lactamase
VVNPRNGYGYGLGWFIGFPGGKKMVDHTGGVDGFLSASAFLPELRLGVIVLTNTDNNSLYSSLRDQLLQVYRNEPFVNVVARNTARWEMNEKDEATRIAQMRETVAKQKKQAAPNLEAYIGAYMHPLYGDATVSLDKGELKVYLSHHPDGTATLEYMGENRFMCTFGTPTLGIQPMAFSVNADGQAYEMLLKVNDFIEYGTYTFERK